MYVTKCSTGFIICLTVLVTIISLTIHLMALYYNYITDYNNICFYVIPTLHMFGIISNSISYTIINVYMYGNYRTPQEYINRAQQNLHIFILNNRVNLVSGIILFCCCIYFFIEFHTKIPENIYLRFYRILGIIYYSLFLFMFCCGCCYKVNMSINSRITNPTTRQINNIVSTFEKTRTPTEIVCCVCLENRIDTNDTTKLWYKLPCSHEIHVECLDTWFKRTLSCPVCRNNFAQTN